MLHINKAFFSYFSQKLLPGAAAFITSSQQTPDKYNNYFIDFTTDFHNTIPVLKLKNLLYTFLILFLMHLFCLFHPHKPGIINSLLLHPSYLYNNCRIFHNSVVQNKYYLSFLKPVLDGSNSVASLTPVHKLFICFISSFKIYPPLKY